MRIVLSNTSKKWGGVHTVTEILARGFLVRGHDVRIFGSPDTMLEERMRDVAPFDAILGAMDFSPASMWRVSRTLRAHRTDVVLTLTKKDVTLSGPPAYGLRIPVVIRHANQQAVGWSPHFRFLYGEVPAMHVTNAEATRRTILESAPWLSPERVRVIYNGVDPAPFINADPIPLQLGAGATKIGFVGSFEGRKGVIELANGWRRVAAALPHTHLLLCGKGSKEDEMRHILDGAPNVHWLGYRKDVPSVMRALDMLVLPSHVEGAPNAVLEAMTAGAAVVATGVSGTPELVRDGIEARLIPARDEEALVAALIEVASNSELRQAMIRASKLRVGEKFTIPRMLDAYEGLFSAVIG